MGRTLAHLKPKWGAEAERVGLSYESTKKEVFVDSEWQWHQLGHMQVCTSLQSDNHASTPPLSFLQAGCPSCPPTNSVKALKAQKRKTNKKFSGNH